MRIGRISPTASVLGIALANPLRAHDQGDCFLRHGPDSRLLSFAHSHAHHLRQAQGGNAVAVHARTIRSKILILSAPRIVTQNKIQRPAHRGSDLSGIRWLVANGAQRQQSQSRHGISIAGRLAGFWIVKGPVDLLHFLDKPGTAVHGDIHAVLLRKCTRSGPATDRHSTHAQQPLAAV